MADIIAIINQKGGVGKTTTAINVGVALVQEGKSVLLIDLDPQANASQGLGVETAEDQPSVYDALRRDPKQRIPLNKVMLEREGLMLAPGSIAVAALEVELLNSATQSVMLRNALNSVRGMFDYIVIDCPPTLTTLTTNALVAANWVMIPMQTQAFSVRALNDLFGTINETQEANPDLRYMGIIPTFVDRAVDSKRILKSVREELADYVMQTTIPARVVYREAQSDAQSIFGYNSRDREKQASIEVAREAYRILAKEIISRVS